MINIWILRSKSFINKIIYKLKNRHNSTIISRGNCANNINVGNYSYGVLNVHSSNLDYKLKIGNFCSIAEDVMFLLSSDHNIRSISSFPFKVKALYECNYEGLSKGDIIVDDDVWIGYGATIMSGVHIGQGAVIAAGSVITKNVPPYAVVGGVPAKIIKYRFEESLINELLKIDYSKLTKEMIEEHVDDLYADLVQPSQLDWIPKKKKG